MIAGFVGASNVATGPGSFPEKLCNVMGWTCVNVAVGGTGFTHGSRPWLQQAQDLAAECGPDQPDIIFVAGGGNDIRAGVSVKTEAALVHQYLAVNFPNARVISVPGLWNAKGVHPNLSRVVHEMREAALNVGHEVIWHAWEWLIGRPECMEGEIHPNSAGYDVFVRMIRHYLQGGSTAAQWADGIQLAPGVALHSNGVAQCICVDGIVYTQLRVVRTSGTFSLGQTIATVPAWAAASRSSRPRGIPAALAAWDKPAGAYIYPDGRETIRGSGVTSATEVSVFAAHPIGQ